MQSDWISSRMMLSMDLYLICSVLTSLLEWRKARPNWESSNRKIVFISIEIRTNGNNNNHYLHLHEIQKCVQWCGPVYARGDMLRLYGKLKVTVPATFNTSPSWPPWWSWRLTPKTSSIFARWSYWLPYMGCNRPRRLRPTIVIKPLVGGLGITTLSIISKDLPSRSLVGGFPFLKRFNILFAHRWRWSRSCRSRICWPFEDFNLIWDKVKEIERKLPSWWNEFWLPPVYRWCWRYPAWLFAAQ